MKHVVVRLIESRGIVTITELHYQDFYHLLNLTDEALTITLMQSAVFIKTFTGRSRLFDAQYQLIIFLIWYRHYPTEDFLEWLLSLPENSIHWYLKHTLQVLFDELQHIVTLPDYSTRRKLGVQFCDCDISVVCNGVEQ